jgi:hypothetical protein
VPGKGCFHAAGLRLFFCFVRRDRI